MKTPVRIVALIVLSAMIVSITSCASITYVSHDNGRHEGWFKNPNNPHNPNTTKVKTKPVKPEKTTKKILPED